MFAINAVTASQSSATFAGRRFVLPQSEGVPQAGANTSSVAISSAAMNRASFEHGMAERLAGRSQQRAIFANDPSNPAWAEAADQMAHHTFNEDTDLLYDITGTISGGDSILRYSSGDPVTTESRAYALQQGNRYQSALLELYGSEMAKKTPPGDILIKMMDLQEQQPARFRAMAMWPTAADFVTGPTDAAAGTTKS